MRPNTDVGDDPLYLEHCAAAMEKQGTDAGKIHAARLREIGHKVKHLESATMKGMMGYIKELEKKAAGNV